MAPGFVISQGARGVKTYPGDCNQIGLVAAKPRIDVIAGSAGFPGQVGAAQLFCLGGGASLHHILHHAGYKKGIARIDDLFGIGPREDGFCLFQYIAFLILYALDEIGYYAKAAIGECGIPHRHLYRCYRTGA